MLLSIALILLVGMSMGWICRKIKLPGLLGMLITGIVLGPYVLNVLDIKLLGISADLRKSPDYYSDKSGAWTGFNESKKNRKTCGFNVLCAGNV